MEDFGKFFVGDGGRWLSTSFPGSLSLGTGRRLNPGNEVGWLDLHRTFCVLKKSEVVILHNVIDEIEDILGCLECYSHSIIPVV